jgi:hypothetical protein
MPKPKTWSLTPEEALERISGRLFATVTETSIILGYDEMGRTVRKAIAAGDVPAVKAGSTYRVPVSWILQQTRLGGGTAA